MHVLPFQALDSTIEVMNDDGTSRFDYKTAHSRARDPNCEVFLPGSCEKCFQQESSAAEQGWSPSAPDQEIPLEVQRDLR